MATEDGRLRTPRLSLADIGTETGAGRGTAGGGASASEARPSSASGSGKKDSPEEPPPVQGAVPPRGGNLRGSAASDGEDSPPTPKVREKYILDKEPRLDLGVISPDPALYPSFRLGLELELLC